MSRSRSEPPPVQDGAERLLPPDTTVLDLLDNVLHKGVLVQASW